VVSALTEHGRKPIGPFGVISRGVARRCGALHVFNFRTGCGVTSLLLHPGCPLPLKLSRQVTHFCSGSRMADVQIRGAEESDAEALARLMGELGYPLDLPTARERLRTLAREGSLLHRAGIVGRITAFVVSSGHRGQGIGAHLLRAAEELLWAQGCERIEITSGERRVDAHRFYERAGYHVESKRFLKHRMDGPPAGG
jgi:GNAT superfamily N-acetyltransferase